MSSEHSAWLTARPSLGNTQTPASLLAGMRISFRATELRAAELAAERAATAACRALADGDRPKAVLHLIDALIHTETADNLENEAHSDRHEEHDRNQTQGNESAHGDDNQR